jgi:hypothetical protein
VIWDLLIKKLIRLSLLNIGDSIFEGNFYIMRKT